VRRRGDPQRRRIGPVLALAAAAACGRRDQPAGEIEGDRRPPAAVAAAAAAEEAARHAVGLRSAAPAAAGAKRILFGDLHVHTTYSFDAFVFSLPLFGGEGAHPPADACDFARWCAAVDFFALTDHAEGLTPERWRRSKESIRQCNARAGDAADPDLVAFVGWEWTQAGETPETHYGHRNVIFPGLADDELPARPITSLPDAVMRRAPRRWLLQGLERGLGLLAPLGLGGYADLLGLVGRLADIPNCAPGVDTRALPPDCRENAPTPRELFEKLGQWGLDVLVIPHGLAWGLHAPPGARMDEQLAAGQHDPARQRLLEIFSGHGNSEEYRPWRASAVDAAGRPVCPAPTPDFLPCCWRAGEIMRARCGAQPAAECEARVEEAKRLALRAGVAPHLVFPDTRTEDWLDCDQCRDCFKPAFALRPRESAQYGLAISRFAAGDTGAAPERFRWGFVASSDDHGARPGTGYKQLGRKWTTDSHGLRSPWHERLVRRRVVGTQADPERPQAARRDPRTFTGLLDVERVASFMYPGGLVAAHATGRRREEIWDALRRREVYGTSGPRILLWFDLLNAPGGPAPMGSEVVLAGAPRFEVRAVGAFVERPGCPAESLRGLSPARLEALCRGECHHPGDERHPIVAVEVVRVRPQRHPGESVDGLIEDPWRRFACAPDPGGCVVAFEDPEYAASGRDAVYYVRALQEATPAVNGANYRTEFDAQGSAVRTRPCHGDWRTPAADDCLAPVEERAWSSPIFVDRPRPGGDG
jgi:hypothetical protein